MSIVEVGNEGPLMDQIEELKRSLSEQETTTERALNELDDALDQLHDALARNERLREALEKIRDWHWPTNPYRYGSEQATWVISTARKALGDNNGVGMPTLGWYEKARCEADKPYFWLGASADE